MQRRTLLFVSTLALALLGGVRSSPLNKRFAGDGTFYDAGLGACGETNSNNELVCAMNAAQYPGSCNKVVSITGPKGTVTCTIKDLCPVCAFGSIDMSPAAFNAIADPAAGRVPITWSFGGDAQPQPQPSPQSSPQSSPQPPPPPPPAPKQSPPPPLPEVKVQKDADDDDDDDDDNDNDENDNSTDINSVSYAFMSGDFSLINGGKLAAGVNPLDDPDGYSSEIISNLSADDGGCDVDQSDDGDDEDDDDDDDDDDDHPCNTKPVTDPDAE